MRSRLVRTIAAALAGLTPLIASAEPRLKAGDPAPGIQVAEWLHGEPVREFDADKAYLIEFWASWCAPCIASMPHIEKLHQKFADKGLVIAAVAVWENDVKAARTFVKKQTGSGRLNFRFALDDTAAEPRGHMATHWLTAAGRNSIPTTALVDGQGRVAWIGSPSKLNEAMIESLLAGTFSEKDVEAAARQMVTDRALHSRTTSAISGLIRDGKFDEAREKLAEAENGIFARDASTPDRLRILLGVASNDLALARTTLAKVEANSQIDHFRAQVDCQIAFAIMPYTDRPEVAQFALEQADRALARSPDPGFGLQIEAARVRALAGTGKGDEARAARAALKQKYADNPERLAMLDKLLGELE